MFIAEVNPPRNWQEWASIHETLRPLRLLHRATELKRMPTALPQS